MNKAVFLDRDGTINIDINGYVKTPEEFELFPYAAKAIKMLKKSGYLVIVVTNQSGVARGIYTHAGLNRIHAKMHNKLEAEGTYIDGLYLSPWYYDGIIAPYNISHPDRKPGLGMFYRACYEYSIDPKASYMVGDRRTDIYFGKKAGLKSMLLRCGEGEKYTAEDLSKWSYKPDLICDTLLEAAQIIRSEVTV